MTRTSIFVLSVGLLLSGCAMIESEALPGKPSGYARASEGNTMGQYCLSRALLQLDIVGTANDRYSLSPKVTRTGDWGHLFRLDMDPDAFASDDLRIDYGDKPETACLLKAVANQASDQSGRILEQLAELGLQLGTGVPKPTLAGGGLHAAEPEPTVFSFNVDITDTSSNAGSLAAYQSALKAYSAGQFSIEVHGLFPNSDVASAGANSNAPSDRTVTDAVLYRVPQPYLIVLNARLCPKGLNYFAGKCAKDESALKDARDASALKPVASTIVMVENAGPIAALDVRRSFFVDRQTTINFEDGILKDIRVQKPSELSAFLNVPIDIAQAILSAPEQLLTLRIKETTDQDTLVKDRMLLQNDLATAGAAANAARGSSRPSPPD